MKVLISTSQRLELNHHGQIVTWSTDSTQHNKGFAKILADMFNLDTLKGQLFCGTHTTLGFSTTMNRILSVIERDMTLIISWSIWISKVKMALLQDNVILRLVAQTMECQRILNNTTSNRPNFQNSSFYSWTKEKGQDS